MDIMSEAKLENEDYMVGTEYFLTLYGQSFGASAPEMDIVRCLTNSTHAMTLVNTTIPYYITDFIMESCSTNITNFEVNFLI